MRNKSAADISSLAPANPDYLEDKLKLESLISQVLPSLIKKNDIRLKDILNFAKDKKSSLKDFLNKYPEFQAEKIKPNQSAMKTIKQLRKDSQAEFVALVDFNHEILSYLEDLIKERKIFVFSQSDLNYLFQFRLALYQNFNRYLNIILLKDRPEKEAVAAAKKLLNIKGQKQFLTELSLILKRPAIDIINDFLNLAASAKIKI